MIHFPNPLLHLLKVKQVRTGRAMVKHLLPRVLQIPPPTALQNWVGHLPQLLPEYEKVSSIVDGPGRDPLGPISKLVEAVVDVPNEFPADSKLSLDVGREEVLAGRIARLWITGWEGPSRDDALQERDKALQRSSSSAQTSGHVGASSGLPRCPKKKQKA